METKNEVAVVKPKKIKPVKQAVITVPGDETSNFIQLAIANGASVEIMEKMFALRQKVNEEKARGAFVKAMADFQAECPIIEKTKKVNGKDGKLRYEYAPLETIVAGIRGILSKNRLSYKWEVENKEGIIKATAVITHEAGHSESSSFEIPIDKDGYMTAPQKYASALTYAKRYALVNVLGISTGEDDTDATDVNKEPEAKSPKARIVMLMRLLGVDPNSTKQEFEAASMELVQLPLEEKNYCEIIDRLTLMVQEKQDDNYQEK